MRGATHQQRVSRSERVAVLQPCRYEMTESDDPDTVLLHQGEALSVNVSTGGMLLLMPHSPGFQQVFEVYAPTPSKKKLKKLTLVEVRWTRRIPVESGENLSLVGVKFLLSPLASETTKGSQ